MVDICNVSFKYSNSDKYALSNINLHISQGEFIVLLGESGCGKTTITRLINHLVPEFFSGDLEGNIAIDGKDTSDLKIQDLAGIVGSVFQDPRSQFFTTDTTAEIAFSCENIGIPREEICKRIETAVNALQIHALLERNIFELSSGEKQSVAVASVYALTPKIIVLDEPSANLDVDATNNLKNVLTILKKQGYTIIISEHRIHYLKDIADRALLIKNGEIANEFTAVEFNRLTNEKANKLGLRSIELNSIKIAPCKRRNKETQYEIRHLSFSYNKSVETLKSIELAVGAGDIVGIIGDNGAGKSTLLEIICGLRKERSGEIIANGANEKPKDRIKKSYMVMQDSDCQLFAESVENELYLGNKISEELKKKSDSVIENLGLSEYLHQHPASLSGGQKQRLCIAVACMKDAEIICFDEPTSGLDYYNMLKVTNFLHMLSYEKRTLFVVSHDYEFLISACTHICHLRDGQIENLFAINQDTVSKVYKIMYKEDYGDEGQRIIGQYNVLCQSM